MEPGNQTPVTEFVLEGLPNTRQFPSLFFLLFVLLYLLTLLGNVVVILLTMLNSTLHTPMYFFLGNLSFLEICFTSSVVPQLLVHLLVEEKTISLVACAAQMYVFTIMGLTECCLLAGMAYDRYVAICRPLHYATIMSGRACVLLAGASWVIGITMEVAKTMWIFSLPFCGSNRIPHFFCDVEPVRKKACTDTWKIEILGHFVSGLFIMSPFLLILLSYILIICTILRLPSAESRHKAFSTCSSHLMVVTLFYGTGLIIYLMPKSSSTLETDQMISLLNTIVSPLLSPIIYTLRNKEVKGAFRKTVEKSIFAQSW
nr:olfactory receptor 10A4-like [Pelodiscus sinensis]|eukprot:XP_025045000.1 olfactory receptor 10A4-like [Pelodiscus sinensis]